MEPNLWFDFGAWGLAAMSTHRTGPRQHDGDIDLESEAIHERLYQTEQDSISLGEFLRKWTHLGITVTLGIFLFTQWQASGKERGELEREVSLQRAEANALAKIVEEHRREDHELMDAMQRRLDAQRSDIRDAQQNMVNHYQQDDRKFRALGK